MIAGIGLDLVEIARIAAMVERHDEVFLRRVLHAEERTDRIRRADGAAHLAGLFAAKEAVMKALGTGMAGAAFAEIVIRHDEAGQPHVELVGETAARASQSGIRAWHVSITHDKTTAAAVAIALR